MVEPGTRSKPGFLYQQNTVRDAVSAGIYLNEFNKHCERVKMANICTNRKRLAGMVLTEGPKMPARGQRITYLKCTRCTRGASCLTTA
jgi:alpha-N-arabinofuranosidase